MSVDRSVLLRAIDIALDHQRASADGTMGRRRVESLREQARAASALQLDDGSWVVVLEGLHDQSILLQFDDATVTLTAELPWLRTVVLQDAPLGL